LADAVSCKDWNPSIPIDRSRIRPEDEEYWEKYRGTPKAVISYDKAAQIWGNRFGVCTAVRIPGNIGARDGTARAISVDEIEAAVTLSLTPSICGIQLAAVRTGADGAADSETDLTPLFLGLSFFMFAATLLLIWLLSALQVKSRAEEHKILTAVGYSRKHLLLVYMSEGVLVFSIGTIAGALLSPLYTLTLIGALKSVWKAAAMTPVLNLHIEILPILIGSAAAFACALLSMFVPVFFAARRRPPKDDLW
jgi:ABC-type antimicrobial peptide transport system permease subunit